MHDPNDEEDQSFMGRHGGKILFLLVALFCVGGFYVFSNSQPEKKKSKPVDMVVVMPVLPPPPPPPPPPQQKEEPPPEEVKEEEFVPETAPEVAEPEPTPAEAEPAPAGTNIEGNGPPDNYGLTKGGSNGLGGRGIGGTGTKSRSKFGWYAGKVQSVVAEAMRTDKRTRAVTMSVQVKIWADKLGRVTRAQLVGSTGNSALDIALRDEVLTGIQLPEPPPSDMPMPINLRITARQSL